jgi:acyl-CoA synthetase (AMP-forming)/AMP-acid ligase II
MSIGLIPLPLFHDMGLIGGVMQPLYAGFPVEILNPILAVQKPADWLRRISISRVTTSGGPNFLFELACKLVSDDDLIQLDLSSWKIAFCGAEPVRRSTVEAFIKRFGPVGFRRQAFFPCYGLAEATLYVTGAALDTTDLTLDLDLETPVPCGIPGLDITVRIVDLQTGLEAPEGVEGEIWVTGPGVAKGYWNSPVQSQVVFGAEISDSSDGPFVRTGDLGHILGNKLYVTGRLKDLIIVRGRNFAPQDLECSAEQSHPSLVLSGSAAFCIHGRDKDSLVIVAEVNRQTLRRPEDWPAIEAAVRSAITVAFQLKVDDVVLLRPGNLPRTSSGKVRRNQCRTDYLAQTLVRVSAESVPETG